MHDFSDEKFAPLRKGLLEFAVLKVIASKKAYAADILERLSVSDFKTQDGTLYPLLSKMRRDGLVEYEWVESEAGPPRKYYSLTKEGVGHLQKLTDYWDHLSDTIKKLGKKV